MNNFYSIDYCTYDHPKAVDFQQHIHDCSEIYVFIEGSGSYEVEAASFSLEPYDILIIPANMLHGIRHEGNKKYSRIVIYIDDNFFKEIDSPEYMEIFKKKSGIKISGVVAELSGVRDVINNLKKYSNNFTDCNNKISEACLIQLLHILNSINEGSRPTVKNNNIQKIISFINQEYKNDISLDELSEKFFISKYHLCREFKKLTGHTIHEYINIKKLQKVKELCNQGVNIGNACAEAGFNSYSSFYRYYKKRFSNAPGNWLKT